MQLHTSSVATQGVRWRPFGCLALLLMLLPSLKRFWQLPVQGQQPSVSTVCCWVVPQHQLSLYSTVSLSLFSRGDIATLLHISPKPSWPVCTHSICSRHATVIRWGPPPRGPLGKSRPLGYRPEPAQHLINGVSYLHCSNMR